MKRWELPQGWDKIRLNDEVIDILSGFSCARKYAVQIGLLHLRPFNIGINGELDLTQQIYVPDDRVSDPVSYYLQKEDILFNNTNSVELVGKSAIVRKPMECAFSNHLTRIRVIDQERLNPQWLLLALRTLWLGGFFAANCNRWIGQAGFAPTKLAELEIPAPLLAEQRRIVARLEALLGEVRALREEVQSMRRDLAQVMESAMAEVFPNPQGEVKEGWLWRRLSEISIINPRRPLIQRNDDEPTSFVPMQAVSEYEGKIYQMQIRPYGEVKQGYTYFEENDVLLAKITPSMENGKVAIARGLLGGIGFGTTEFHVFRPVSGILPEWIFYYIRRKIFREEAKNKFRGAVGQQRVPEEFLIDYPIPIPYPDNPARSLAEQRRIVAYLERIAEEIRAMDALLAQDLRDLDALEQSILAAAFRGEM